MPPCELGAFQMIRQALTACPNSSTNAASRVCTAAEWPSPSNSTIEAASSTPSSREPAVRTASTGQSFSRVRGSAGPTRSQSARITEVSAGTPKPAASAICAAERPTTAAFSRPPEQASPPSTPNR